MGSTSLRAIFLIVFCTLFTSLGQLLWKAGINQMQPGILHSIINFPFVGGSISYALGAILMILAFREGELSVLYPIIATSYVWVSLFSPLWFSSDFMNSWKWAGVLVILFSVSLLGIGDTMRKGAND